MEGRFLVPLHREGYSVAGGRSDASGVGSVQGASGSPGHRLRCSTEGNRYTGWNFHHERLLFPKDATASSLGCAEESPTWR